jgi:hypothetical protein
MEKENVIEVLSEFCRATAEAEGENYVFSLQSLRMNGHKLLLPGETLEEVIQRLSGLDVHEETALVSLKTYEVAVREESVAPFRRLREDKIEVSNQEAGLRYELSPASDAYLVWMLAQMKDRLDPRDVRGGMIYRPSLERLIQEEGGMSPLEYIRETSFRWLTLKIYGDKPSSAASYARLTYAFLFQIAYNLDVSLVPQRLIEEMVRSGRINRMRRSRTEEIDPPRRVYNEDLVQHYLLAVSTENPVIEYLSYYHVLEYFFESVFNDDLVNTVRDSITDPGFSYKRKKDINLLINSIKKSLQIRSETITFSEAEALRLCIERFVSMPDLIDKLNAYDGALLDFYKSSKVEFSSGVEVDLRSLDSAAVAKALAKRIYSTRNSLVHSKEGERSKYTPFKDDRALVKEVPLLRFISEMVIVNESVVQ